MKKFFVVYGTLICVLFAFSSYRGMPFLDAFDSSKWTPKGQQKVQATSRGGGYRGFHRTYHK
jgi:hypothetical protein